MQLKHIKTTGLVLLLAFVVLYGPLWLYFSSPERDLPEDVTELTIATWAAFSAEGANIEEEIFKAFMEENPDIIVRNIYTPWDAYRNKLLTMFVGSNPPDLCWIQLEHLPFLASRGVLHDLTDIVTKDRELKLKNYYKVALDICSYERRIYGLPRDLAGWFIAYNQDLFDKAYGYIRQYY